MTDIVLFVLFIAGFLATALLNKSSSHPFGRSAVFTDSPYRSATVARLCALEDEIRELKEELREKNELIEELEERARNSPEHSLDRFDGIMLAHRLIEKYSPMAIAALPFFLALSYTGTGIGTWTTHRAYDAEHPTAVVAPANHTDGRKFPTAPRFCMMTHALPSYREPIYAILDHTTGGERLGAAWLRSARKPFIPTIFLRL